MLYLYSKEAGTPHLTLLGDEHRYIFRVRRHKKGEQLHLRNLADDLLYTYIIEHLDKKSAVLALQESRILEVKAKYSLHIGWCMVDPKSIEKVLPSLNEMGVAKITFIYCKRSQKSFKVDFKRLEKILLNSSQQCGRSQTMVLEVAESLEVFLMQHPQSALLNFSAHRLSSKERTIETIVVGCEGGITSEEVVLFEEKNVLGFDTPMVLKSESAVCAVASTLLL